ncbi:MAG: TonB-dependent receptor plug domain-containing protein [Prolixibacteraceae bacterium]|nr:TonB-dependent receptor plug domain-containing protein [Prolixibacteraceae bacterium]
MKLNLTFLFLIFSFFGIAQSVITGTIVDAGTRESLISAHCIDVNSNTSTVTNNQGYFSIRVTDGNVKLTARYVGYITQDLNLFIKNDTLIQIEMEPLNVALGEVRVVDETFIHEQTLLGKNIVPLASIEKGVSSFGIPDLMKAITSIPGIASGRDGRANVFVRGGDRGQNLVLLDGAKLYSTNHFGGFLSLFNTEIVKQVDVYKGGFPARYGGRASSIIDIHTRDGNRNHYKGKFNLGLLNSGFLIEGPINKKMSYLVALRTSYYDLYSLPEKYKIKKYSGVNYFNVRFFDINAKLSYFATQRSKYFINIFSGSDNNTYADRSLNTYYEEGYNIKNRCITIGNYNSLGATLFLKNTASYSLYSNEVNTSTDVYQTGNESLTEVESTSNIREYNLQSKLEYYPNSRHAIKAGVEFSNYNFNPGKNTTYEMDANTGFENDTTYGYRLNLNANEVSMFIEDEVKLGPRFFMNVGLRQVFFLGSGKNYSRTEPRISLRTMLNDNVSVKTGYSVMNQFNHVVVNSFGVYENEIWMASSKKIPPQHARQFSMGVFSTVPSTGLSFSAEAYYKTMSHLLEYNVKPDENAVIQNIDELLIGDGEGLAYGFEIHAKYKHKRFAAEMGYTLAWNYRKFDELNGGDWYPFLYDRRHSITAQVSQQFGKGYSLNTNFVFSSGVPYTMPVGFVKEDKYMYEYFAYKGYNNVRLPCYHRLDVAVAKEWKTKKGRKQRMKFDIYNAYARQNALLVYHDKNTGTVKKKSMFSVVPTLNYSLEF